MISPGECVNFSVPLTNCMLYHLDFTQPWKIEPLPSKHLVLPELIFMWGITKFFFND